MWYFYFHLLSCNLGLEKVIISNSSIIVSTQISQTMSQYISSCVTELNLLDNLD